MSATCICMYMYFALVSQISMNLHDACNEHNYDKVKELLDGGADPNAMLVMPLAVFKQFNIICNSLGS